MPTNNGTDPQDGAGTKPQDGTNPNVNAGDSGANPPQDGGGANNGAGFNLSPEAYQAELERARREAAESRVKLRQYEEAQRLKQEEEAKQRGEFERLYNDAKAKAEALESEAEQLRKFKAEVEAAKEAERVRELEKLPDDVRAAFAGATIEQIRVVQAKLAATGASPDASRGKVSPQNNGSGSAKQHPLYGGFLDALDKA